MGSHHLLSLLAWSSMFFSKSPKSRELSVDNRNLSSKVSSKNIILQAIFYTCSEIMRHFVKGVFEDHVYYAFYIPHLEASLSVDNMNWTQTDQPFGIPDLWLTTCLAFGKFPWALIASYFKFGFNNLSHRFWVRIKWDFISGFYMCFIWIRHLRNVLFQCL